MASGLIPCHEGSGQTLEWNLKNQQVNCSKMFDQGQIG